jgi:hypothetical protein
LIGKPQGKRPEERTKHSVEDNIKTDLKATGWVGMEQTDLAQN